VVERLAPGGLAHVGRLAVDVIEDALRD